MGAGLSAGLIYLLLFVGLSIIIISVSARFVNSYLSRDKTLAEIESKIRSKDYKAVLTHMTYAKKSKDFMPMYYMATAYEGLGEHRNAAACYEECAVRIPDVDRDFKENINFRIAENYRKEGRIREALGFYNLIDRDNHPNWKVSYHVADILYELKNYPNCKKYVEEFIRQHPADVDGLLLYGKVSVQLNLFVNAVKTLNIAIESGKLSEKDNNEAKFYLAKALMNKKNYADAELLFKTLIGVRDYRDEVFTSVITMKVQNGEPEKALEFYNDRFMEIDSEARDEGLYEIAAALWKAGSSYEAIGLWKEIESRNPSFKDVAVILSQNKELAEHTFLRNVFSKDEKNANFIANSLNMGRLYNLEMYGVVWFFYNDTYCHIVVKSPTVVGLVQFIEISKHIKELNLSSHELFIYSLKGFVPECQDYPDYHRMTKYEGNEFVMHFKNSAQDIADSKFSMPEDVQAAV
jgi:tetratricopeptide (TPR) repeat protein